MRERDSNEEEKEEEKEEDSILFMHNYKLFITNYRGASRSFF
jgi:hypothetical protein